MVLSARDILALAEAMSRAGLWKFHGLQVEHEFSFDENESDAFHGALVGLCAEDYFSELSAKAREEDDADLSEIVAKAMAFFEKEFGLEKSPYAVKIIESKMEEGRVERSKRNKAQKAMILGFLGREAKPLPRPTDPAIRSLLKDKFEAHEKWLDRNDPNPDQNENGTYLHHAYEAEIISALLELGEGEASLSPRELLEGTLEARLPGFSERWYMLSWALVARCLNVVLPGIEVVSPPRPALAA